MNVLRLVHFFGLALWLGGGFAMMVIRVSTSAEPPAMQAAIARLSAKVQTRVIAIGALLTVVSGLILSTTLPSVMMSQLRIIGMQASGLVAAMLVLFVGVPTAAKLGRAAVLDASGQLPAVAGALRKRLATVSSISGVLVLTALVFAVMR